MQMICHLLRNTIGCAVPCVCCVSVCVCACLCIYVSVFRKLFANISIILSVTERNPEPEIKSGDRMEIVCFCYSNSQLYPHIQKHLRNNSLICRSFEMRNLKEMYRGKKCVIHFDEVICAISKWPLKQRKCDITIWLKFIHKHTHTLRAALNIKLRSKFYPYEI